jgi:tRNA (cytidine/uridine-2'-O-)-methyltransferase
MFAFTTKGTNLYTDVRYARDDVLVFGAETHGLSKSVLERFRRGNRLRLPMRPGNRSLNLSNAVAVVVFEAWRQLAFGGGA